MTAIEMICTDLRETRLYGGVNRLCYPVQSIGYNLDYFRRIIREEFNLRTRIEIDDFGNEYLLAF